VVEQGTQTGEFRTDSPALTVRALLGSLNWIPVWYRPDPLTSSAVTDNHLAREVALFVVAGARGVGGGPAPWADSTPVGTLGPEPRDVPNPKSDNAIQGGSAR
jgi:hypothetical protein